MRYILTIILAAITFIGQAQTPTQQFNGNLYQYNFGHYVKGSHFVPRDTTSWVGSMGDSGRIAYKGGSLYYHNGLSWQQVPPGNIGYVNVEWFGAKGDGSTNNDAAFLAARNTGRNIIIPNGIFNTSDPVELYNGQSIFGNGRNSVIFNTANNHAIVCDSGNTVKGLAIYGDATIGSYTSNKLSQNGVRITGTGVLVEGVYFRGLGGSAVRVDSTLNAYFGTSRIIGCYGENNNIGLNFDIWGEYVTASNCGFSLCNIGARIVAGNISLIGGDYNNNKVGVWLVGGGGNDGHCVASGVKINHNTDYAVRADDLVEGYTFDGCMLYYGGIWLKDCQLVTFVNCDINTTGNGLKEEGAKDCYFLNNKFRQFPGHQPNFNGDPSRVFFQNNTYDDSDLGIKPYKGSFGYNVIGGFWRGDCTADVNILTGATHYIDWDSTYYNGVSGNLIDYTLDTFWNATLKRFECKGYGNGQVYMKGQVTVEIPVAGDIEKIFCIISINDATGVFSTPFRRPASYYNNGTTYQMAFDLNITLDVEATDNITIYFINLTGQTIKILSEPSVTFISAQGF